jgi:hypothetical protein
VAAGNADGSAKIIFPFFVRLFIMSSELQNGMKRPEFNEYGAAHNKTNKLVATLPVLEQETVVASVRMYGNIIVPNFFAQYHIEEILGIELPQSLWEEFVEYCKKYLPDEISELVPEWWETFCEYREEDTEMWDNEDGEDE